MRTWSTLVLIVGSAAVLAGAPRTAGGQSVPSLSLALPEVSIASGGYGLLVIRATVSGLQSANLVFLAGDGGVIESATLVSHGLAPGAETAINVVDDTVFVALASGAATTLNDEPLVTLDVKIAYPVRTQTIGLTWDEANTHVNETQETILLINGRLDVVLYGDVSENGNVTAYDASFVLQSVVGLLEWRLDEALADVTANGYISSYDAAHILQKVADPEHRFPVELLGGDQAMPRLALATPRALAWLPDGTGWALTLLSDPSGVMSGDVTLVLATDAPVRVSGGDLLACNQTGRELHVAFARVGPGSPVLFRLESDAPSDGTPIIAGAALNEGRIPLAEGRIPLAPQNRPADDVLQQNTPNPFNPRTVLRFSAAEAATVRLAIYDVHGRHVRTLVDGPMQAGQHEVVWDGTDSRGASVASGVYIYRLERDRPNSNEATVRPNSNEVRVRRMSLVR